MGIKAETAPRQRQELYIYIYMHKELYIYNREREGRRQKRRLFIHGGLTVWVPKEFLGPGLCLSVVSDDFSH